MAKKESKTGTKKAPPPNTGRKETREKTSTKTPIKKQGK
jgi:hypothetical protein